MVVVDALKILFTIIEYVIFARVLISWLPIPKENKLVQILYMVTEPILAPIRALVEKSSFGKNMMFDISPIVALLLLMVIRSIVFNLIKF